MKKSFQIFTVGEIGKAEKSDSIIIYPEYSDLLLGLEHFSHIIVCTWYHKTDTAKKRETLQVHPRGDKANPLTGIFATRSPVRPNPIGLSICRILKVNKNIIHIDKIDVFDGTPVIDIKPYIPQIDSAINARVADWAK